MLLGSVPEKVHAYDTAPRPIALSDIDHTRALRTKDVQSQAQSFRLSISVHG
jgi:hypothetical protein